MLHASNMLHPWQNWQQKDSHPPPPRNRPAPEGPANIQAVLDPIKNQPDLAPLPALVGKDFAETFSRTLGSSIGGPNRSRRPTRALSSVRSSKGGSVCLGSRTYSPLVSIPMPSSPVNVFDLGRRSELSRNLCFRINSPTSSSSLQFHTRSFYRRPKGIKARTGVALPRYR